MTDAEVDADAALTRAELVAVVVATTASTPQVLTTGSSPSRLPAGPLANQHRSMQAGARTWVEAQTGLDVGYLEQLYTFADRDRVDAVQHQAISVSYLALSRLEAFSDTSAWVNWYQLYPWEDRRTEPGLHPELVAALRTWIEQDATTREHRCATTFGLDGASWLPEMTLQRYEILYEAGLIKESPWYTGHLGDDVVGPVMVNDHRRIVATGIARLRAKIQYRPVVFELMPEEFSLGQLQTCVEAIAGQAVHKQNFRRLVEQQQLVEPTGGRTSVTGGRPARLYRFRRDVIDQRAFSGTKLPRVR